VSLGDGGVDNPVQVRLQTMLDPHDAGMLLTVGAGESEPVGVEAVLGRCRGG